MNAVASEPTALQINDKMHVEPLLGYKLGKQKKIKKYITLDSTYPNNIIVSDNTTVSAIRTINERVYNVLIASTNQYGPPPQPIPNAFRRLNNLKAGFVKHFKTVLGDYRMATRSQFIASRPQHKQRFYKNINADHLATDSAERKHSFVNSFNKVEKLMKSTDVYTTKEKDLVYRLIQPRNGFYNMELGRYISHLEHDLLRSLDYLNNGHKTCCKGMNARQRASVITQHWATFSKPVAVGMDATRFDQSTSVPALEFEHSIYKALYRGDKYLERLLSWQLETHGTHYTSDGCKIKYNVKGNRCSGDMNTSLGNCIIMIFMVTFIANTLNINYRLVDDGDDCVIFMDEKDLAKWQKNAIPMFLDFGYQMKIEEPAREIEEINFCQANPVIDATGEYIMCRNPYQAIAKDSTCVNALSENTYLSWRKAVSDCGMSLSQGIPIMTEFYEFLGRGTERLQKSKRNAFSLEESGFKQLAKGLTDNGQRSVSKESRHSFCKAFNILPSQQQTLEKYYMDAVINTKHLEGASGIFPRKLFPLL